MARPQKKEINLTQDSILALMQEIYNELVEQRNTAIRIQNKMLSMMNQTEDMTVLGPIIKEQQKIINDCVDKKLTLSKLQAQMWQKNTEKDEDFTLSDLEIDDETIQNLIRKDASGDNTYKMKK